MKDKKIRWGLLGAGAILDRFLLGAMQFDDIEIVAVASRTEATAKKQAQKYNIPQVCTYEELLARQDIDIVYIPVPHTYHLELAVKAMNSKKNVLVEKPAGINEKQWDTMVECAKKNDVFLMEASWTRFFPCIAAIKAAIAKGEIGDVRVVSSNFSFRNEDSSSRLLDPERAGGGLLDVGVYNINFQRMIFEKDPLLITGVASIATDELKLNIDEQAAYIMQYDNGALGLMASAVRTTMIDTAYIYGTTGYIVIPHFWKPSEYTLVTGDTSTTYPFPVAQRVDGIEDEGYQYEIAHVNDCLRNNLKESPVMPHIETKKILAACDELRRQWGLKYPSWE